MIPVSEIIARTEAALDAEGFDRYTFVRDFRPAINYAQEWITGVFSSALGSNKFNEEALSDLSFVKIWKTNQFSRFVFQTAQVGHRLWTIVGIYPECEIYPDTSIAQSDLTKSVYSSSHSYVSSYKSCGRTTSEEMNLNRRNPFSPGNEIVTCEELRDYAYKSMTTYRGGYQPAPANVDDTVIPYEYMEIEIFPSYANSILAMEYLKYPESIVLETDSIEYPHSIINMIVEQTLSFLAYKQSGTPLRQASEADLNKLITLMA